MNYILEILISSISVIVTFSGGQYEHAKSLKDFVHDHPHLHELVDKTQAGDVDAKHQFECKSLSLRFNATRKRLPDDTVEEHVVLHFLDDYTTHVTGGQNEHHFVQLEPFILMLGDNDGLGKKLVAFGELLEKARCDFNCFGDKLSEILNQSIGSMSKRQEL